MLGAAQLDRPARPHRQRPSPIPAEGSRSKHDVVIGAVRTTARGEFGLATSAGRMIRLSALDLPTLPPTNGAPSLSGGAPLAAYVDLGKGEEPVTIVPIGADAPVARRSAPRPASSSGSRSEAPKSNDWDVISLKDGDRVVGAAVADRDDLDLVFVTTDAQLLRFPARSVRPQGAVAGGMAGIKLAAGAPGRLLRRRRPGARRRRRHVVGLARAPCPAPRAARSR